MPRWSIGCVVAWMHQHGAKYKTYSVRRRETLRDLSGSKRFQVHVLTARRIESRNAASLRRSRSASFFRIMTTKNPAAKFRKNQDRSAVSVRAHYLQGPAFWRQQRQYPSRRLVRREIRWRCLRTPRLRWSAPRPVSLAPRRLNQRPKPVLASVERRPRTFSANVGARALAAEPRKARRRVTKSPPPSEPPARSQPRPAHRRPLPLPQRRPPLPVARCRSPAADPVVAAPTVRRSIPRNSRRC